MTMHTDNRNRGGGWNRKSVEEHVRDGTYRRDRHGPRPLPLGESVSYRPGHRDEDWWDHESSEPRDERIPEQEQLLRMGLLTDNELDELRASACGIVNQYSQRPFRRTWAWWKFLAPQVRDWAIDEACQLLTMPDELTEREKHIADNGCDIVCSDTRDAPAGLPYLGLSAAEREALHLPPAETYTWHRYTIPGYWPAQFGNTDTNEAGDGTTPRRTTTRMEIER